MKKLIEFAKKSAANLWEGDHPTERLAVTQGFRLCLGLNLPLRYAKWMESDAYLYSLDGYMLHSLSSSPIFTLTELYDYWIEHVYTPEKLQV